MQKRIIIIGDSFSLGVGAQFPEVFNDANQYAPKIQSGWQEEFESAQREYYEAFLFDNRDTSKKETMDFLTNIFHQWTESVYTTDLEARFKENNIGKHPAESDLQFGILSSRKDYCDYPHIWSNVLDSYLDDVEVINLSCGGKSMASVVSSLSTFISINNDHDKYETLVFFQAPEPGRKQMVATKTTFEYMVDPQFTPYDKRMDCVKDFNVHGPTKVKPFRGAEEDFDLAGHHEMYLLHKLYLGEWFQNIFNAQNICKANNFSFAWTTSALSVHEMLEKKKNKDDEFVNVLDLDIRLDRNVVTLDNTFVSLHFKHIHLGLTNMADKGCIMDGTQHFTKETQKLFAGYLANLLLTNEDWWWSK